MRSLLMGLVAILSFVGAAAESPYESLDVVRPRPRVVRSAEQHALVADINRYRSQHGLSGVVVDDRLTAAALAHAEDMAQRRYFGHFSPDGGSLPDRLRKVGFRWRVAAENIALAKDESQANSLLVKSLPHRANMLDPRVREIGVAALGVGVDAALYVEDFAL